MTRKRKPATVATAAGSNSENEQPTSGGPETETQAEKVGIPIFDKAVKAWVELKAKTRKEFSLWATIIEAFAESCDEIETRIGSRPQGSGRSAANTAFKAWRVEIGFADMDRGDVSHALRLIPHMRDIIPWHQQLADNEKRRFNHPRVAYREWVKRGKIQVVKRSPQTQQAATPNFDADDLERTIESLEREKLALETENARLSDKLLNAEMTAQDVVAAITKVNWSMTKHRQIVLLYQEWINKQTDDGP
jgi:hypothetical protein